MLDKKKFGSVPVGRQGTEPEGVRKKLERSGSTASKTERQARSSQPSPEWQQVGAAGRGLLGKLEAQRERMRLIEQLIAWHHDLSQRVAHAQHHFMTRDCSQDHRDLLLEFEHFKLALALAKKGRRHDP